MFADLFETHADLPCLRDGARVLSYAETLALGRGILGDLPPRSLIVLRCSLTAEAVAAYAAALVAGHVPLLIEADLAPVLAEGLIATYRPHAVVDPVAGTVTAGPGTALHPDLGLLLTTSGSTGSPKLVRHSAPGLRANAESIAEYLGLDATERPLLHLPMSYSYGMSVINSHLVVGACICLTRASVMEPGYWEALTECEASSIAGVPFHYQALRRFARQLDVPHLRTLTQAGGRLDAKIVTWFTDWAAERGKQFVVMYGQTEAGPRITWLPPEAAATAPDAIGVPIPGVEIALLDEAGAPVAEGVSGEMVVHSPAVMLGYAEQAADLALGDTLGGRLSTGDMAMRGPDGLLRITGRLSRMLKIYGLRLNLDEIERRIGEDGMTVACFGEDDRMRVLVEDGGDPDAVKAWITETFSLPPRGVMVRGPVQIARTGAGKIARSALEAAWETAE